MTKSEIDEHTVKNSVILICLIGEVVRARGQVPSGHLYAEVMQSVDIDSYMLIIGILKSAGLVEEDVHHMLKWVGPKAAHTSTPTGIASSESQAQATAE